MASKFQQRHYEALAKIVGGLRADYPEGICVINELEDRLALMFAIDNERFKISKFVEACRVNQS